MFFFVFRKYPVPSKEADRRKALDNATKFLVVRHPLDRLVSSYLDKVSGRGLPIVDMFHDLNLGRQWQRNSYYVNAVLDGFHPGGRHDKGAKLAEA